MQLALAHLPRAASLGVLCGSAEEARGRWVGQARVDRSGVSISPPRSPLGAANRRGVPPERRTNGSSTAGASPGIRDRHGVPHERSAHPRLRSFEGWPRHRGTTLASRVAFRHSVATGHLVALEPCHGSIAFTRAERADRRGCTRSPRSADPRPPVVDLHSQRELSTEGVRDDRIEGMDEFLG